MSWQTYRLGDVITLKRGHDLPESQRQDGEVPVVSSSGITGYHNEPKAQAPGVVTGRYGTLGEVFYIEQDYWPLNTALYVTDFKGNHPRFVAYFLQNVLRNYQSDKAAVPGVNRNDLHDMKIRSTDPQSQEKIASILSVYDDLIENNRRRMMLLEEAAWQLYREWFISLRFPGYEHTRIANGLPEGWEYQILAKACLPENGIQTGPFGSQLHQSDYTEEGVPVVMPKDIINFRISVDDIARIPESLADSLGRHRMQEGDVVYGRRGDIGRHGFISRRQAGFAARAACA
jgi:type I restriction enzyme, S subunit